MSKTLCAAPDCDRPTERREFCGMHYSRLLRAGVLPPLPTRAERFWAKVDQSAGPGACWPWMAARDRKGYGRFRDQTATHAALELVGVIVPTGLMVRHHCDNPPCVNPDHLAVGTAKQNTADMIERGHGWWQGRTRCKNGHEFTTANTILYAEGYRRCRECSRISSRESTRRRRRAKKLEGSLS